MAIKYHRTKGIAQRRAARDTPWIQATLKSRISGRHKLLIIYLGLAAAATAILLLTQMNAVIQFLDRPLLYGAGEIVAVEDAGAISRLQLRVHVSPERQLEGWTEVPAEAMDHLALGDWVAARFRVSRNGLDMRIEACGLVALPQESR